MPPKKQQQNITDQQAHLPDSGAKAKPISLRLLTILFCVAAILRVAYVLFVPIDPGRIEHDAIEYETLARNVLAGDGFGYGPDKLTSFRPPLWPHALAGIYAVFGRSHLAAKLCLALIGSALPILIFLIARRMLPYRESLIAGLLVAIYPPLIAMADQLMTETIFSVLTALIILLAIYWRAHPQLKLAVAIGLTTGLAALTRGNIMLFVPLLLGWMLISHRPKGLTHGMIVAVLTAALLAPWTLRNWRVQHAFVPISCNSGYVFSISFFPHPLSMFNRQQAFDYVQQTEPKQCRSETVYDLIAKDNLAPPDFLRDNMAQRYPDEPPLDTEVELDRFLMQKSLEHIRQNPAIMVRKVIKDCLRFWHVKDSWGSYLISWATVLPFALLGLFIAARRDRKFILIHLLLLSAILTSMIFHAAARFRLPYEPFLLIFAVVGFFHLWDRAKRKWLLSKELQVGSIKSE